MADPKSPTNQSQANQSPSELLQALVHQAQQAPSQSLERRRLMHRIVQQMQCSGKLWRGGGSISPEGYEEALQKTWLYFCKNIDAYDASQANVVTWFNNHLRWRIKDYNIEQWNDAKKKATTMGKQASDGGLDPVELIPAPDEIPPILEEVRRWLATEEPLVTVHLRRRPDVNCQVLLMRRLPPETPWKELSQEFKVPVPTLSNFYQQKCMPRLLAFGRAQGYITP